MANVPGYSQRDEISKRQISIQHNIISTVSEEAQVKMINFTHDVRDVPDSNAWAVRK